MREIYASLKVELPEDQVAAADMLAAITARWAEMLKQLDMSSVKSSLTIEETRTRVSKVKRPRIVEGDSPRLAV